MVKQRSKQNNPEQKTRNGINNQDVEVGTDYDLVKQAKQKYENKGQPVKSKFRPEQLEKEKKALMQMALEPFMFTKVS